MTAGTGTRRMSWLIWLLVPAGILLFAGANAHLLYVAVQSAPGCVAHETAAIEYRAAKPAC